MQKSEGTLAFQLPVCNSSVVSPVPTDDAFLNASGITDFTICRVRRPRTGAPIMSRFYALRNSEGDYLKHICLSPHLGHAKYRAYTTTLCANCKD